MEVPRQRNTREENALIKEGKVPDGWKDQPNKLAQKDLDARWTKKNLETFYGYKNHVKADAGSVLITDYAVTDAAIHDSQVLPELVANCPGENLFADSAYKSAQIDALLSEFLMESKMSDFKITTITGHRTILGADIRNARLFEVGADSNLFSGSYINSQKWSIAFMRHPQEPQGLFDLQLF